MMKTHIKFTLVALLITGVIVISGCGNDNDNPADVNNNTKPLAPSNPKPEHNEIDVGTTAALSWTCSDPEDDSLSYDVYFGTLETPALVESNRRGTSFTPESMDFSTTYYWKITAFDVHNDSTTGPVWSFSTLEEINQPPTMPDNPVPDNNAADISITTNLSWECSDPENDTLIYNVFLGQSETPELVSADCDTNYYNPGMLELNQTYYWKIIAYDNHDNISVGSVWNFTTRDNQPPDSIYSPSPPDGADSQAVCINLNWQCSDPDNDPLTYNIYFGDSDPPPLVCSNSDGNSFDTGILEYSRTYFWKIDAIDNYGDTVEGDIWMFTTTELTTLAFITNRDLFVIDVSVPDNPCQIGVCATPGSATGVTVNSGYVYVADCYHGLAVIDVSDPFAPEIIGSCDTPGEALKVSISRDHAFIADGTEGMFIISIADPVNPYLVGMHESEEDIIDISAVGGYAYAMVRGSGFHIYNVANPRLPRRLSEFETYRRGAEAILIDSTFAYLAAGGGGFQVIYVGNPYMPIQSVLYLTDDRALGIAKSGRFVYVAINRCGLLMMDVYTPPLSRRVGQFDLPGEAHDVSISGDYAYVLERAVWIDHELVGGGLRIIDISYPPFLEEVGFFGAHGSAFGVAVLEIR